MQSSLILFLATAAGTVLAQQPGYAQCGGINWTGGTTCVSGWVCQDYNPYYSQCIEAESAALSASACSDKIVSTSSIELPHESTPAATAVPTSSTSQDTSEALTQTSTSASIAVSTTSSISHTSAVDTTVASSASSISSVATSATSTSKTVAYAGVNIAGFDFGCSTDGTCTSGGADPPGQAGINQMKHFVSDDGLNAFRLPMGWQYLVNNNLGGTLDATNFANYDGLVQGCLDAGAAFCLIDIHNYARWNGGIIGQGGPTNSEFTSLWSQLATKYKSQSKVVFGIMNEPVSTLLSLTTYTLLTCISTT